MAQVTCPSCGYLNAATNQRCAQCNADLSARRIPSQPSAPAQKSPWRAFKEWLDKPFQISIPEPLLKLFGKSAPQQAARPNTQILSTPIADGKQPQQEPTLPTRLTAGRPMPTAPISSLNAPQPEPLQPLAPGATLNYTTTTPHQHYLITSVARLTYTTYYNALDLVCRQCQTNHLAAPADGLCPQCRAPLMPVLIHEHPIPEPPAITSHIPEVLALSQNIPEVLKHRAILHYARNVFTVVEHPGRWGVIVRGRQQRSLDQGLAAAMQIGRVIARLHALNFTFAGKGPALREALISRGGTADLYLADLGMCNLLATNATDSHKQRSWDIAFVGELLFYLMTGKEAALNQLNPLPPTLIPIVQRAMQGEYASMMALLTDLERTPATALPDRPLKPMHGQLSDPGRQHAVNEDTLVTFTFDKEQDRKTVPIGFYLVADGMGGHDAGNVASRTVYEVVTSTILNMQVLPDIQKSTRKLGNDVPGELLKHAIQEANAKLSRQAQARGSDMGSTVTAALLIGNLATIANVGDSRTYWLRGGRMEQITQDHSLVARLVDAQVIKPEEVRQHPQRNQIYRSLGQKSDVVVDTFTITLERGDRLLLCCDGLWEMVEDGDIQRLVEQARTPQEACDALVAAANRAGGKDNISVIVVEMV